MRPWLIALVVVVAGAGYFVTTASRTPPVPAAPAAPGAFSFAVLGDAPYFPWEEAKYRRLLRDIDVHDLAFVLHVGDILWKPCAETKYTETRQDFERLRHPVIYTPGDNEWTDCWEQDAGGFDPLERLQRVREIFFRDPEHSSGGRRLPLISQRSRAGFADFVENARWTYDRLLFATVHIVGSGNGTQPHRGAAERDAAQQRIEAAAAWVRETFAEAIATDAPAVVIALHANPFFEQRRSARRPYEPFLTAMAEEAARFARPVLITHGDHHVYIVDRPLAQSNDEPLTDVTRLQVPGSPLVGWVRVTAAPTGTPRFTFQPYW
jgi:hypothetical protein